MTRPAAAQIAPKPVDARESSRAVAAESGARETDRVRTDEVFAKLVTVQLDRVSLRRALDAIAASANVHVQYRESDLDAVTTPVTLHATKLPLGTAFTRVLAGTNLEAVSPVANFITITAATRAVGQPSQGTVVGTVVNAKTKEAIVGATVTVDGAARGVMTDEMGAFRLSLAAGEHSIAIRRLGYGRYAQRVTVTSGQATTLNVTLEAGTSVLDEVIVTGTVVATERKAISTPITIITADDIEKRGITRIDQLFRGEIPGVVALDMGTRSYDGLSTGAMVSAAVYSRGSASLSGGANPLKTYVDGVEILDPSYLGTIDPKSIERIEVVTGPQAATIYGSGAMGGVMQIFTKKGSGRTTPDMTLGIKYGLLQSSFSDAMTPTHDDVINVSGGNGPGFSYAGNLSYRYSGQWQPLLFNRMYGLQAGATVQQGPVTASGSASTTGGENGTLYTGVATWYAEGNANGQFRNFGNVVLRQTRSTSSTQTLGLNVDYRMLPWWQHHLTVGTSQTTLELVPKVPLYITASDSLFENNLTSGSRPSWSYNTTLQHPLGSLLSGTLIVGATGSSGRSTITRGYSGASNATTWVTPNVSIGMRQSSYGGFTSARLAILDRLFLTASVRGEHSGSYGKDHALDWTPTLGAAYTVEYGELTVKTMMSYGRSTRAPNPFYRTQLIGTLPSYDPPMYISQFANPDLTPEYERGPQGGIEVYYGSIVSLTLNHYQQRVSDLILPVNVDTIRAFRPQSGDSALLPQKKFLNAANVRQKGWEATSAITLGAFSLKGVYSWNDSRIISMTSSYQETGSICIYDERNACSNVASYTVGAPFQRVPTHTASGSVGYARGKTSVTMVANWIGASTRTAPENATRLLAINSRTRMYTDRYSWPTLDFTNPGYTKVDLALSQVLNPWTTATLNVTNIGNSFTSDGGVEAPTLGRQTQFGVSLRWPRSR